MQAEAGHTLSPDPSCGRRASSARAFMRRDGLCALDRVAVEQISRNPGRPEGMAVRRRAELPAAATPFNRPEHIDPAHPVFEGWS